MSRLLLIFDVIYEKIIQYQYGRDLSLRTRECLKKSFLRSGFHALLYRRFHSSSAHSLLYAISEKIPAK